MNTAASTVAEPDTESVAETIMARMMVVKSILEDGYTRADFAGISDQEIEAGYAKAYQLIDAGQAAKAEELLVVLCQLDHYQSRLWMALGVARQMQRNYQKACEAYAVAGMHDTSNPHLPIRVAECFMAQRRWQDAADAAEGCQLMCGDNPEHEPLRKRAETILVSARRKLGST